MRRAHRLDYLIGTYRILANLGSDPTADPDEHALLKKASEDIYLLGSHEQQEAMETLLTDLSGNGKVPSPDELLRVLRRTLRDDLHIKGGIDLPLRLAP